MKFSELPIDIVDQILPHLPVESLLGLSKTCRQFYALCNDDCVWQGRVTRDFGLASFMQHHLRPPQHHPRQTYYYKSLYRDLDGALQTFAWGENSDKRLGFGDQLSPHRHMFMRQICLPRELRAMRGRAVATIVAGRWSFHALDRRGRVWMWGLMHPRVTEGRHPLVPHPTQVCLPSAAHITSIASGQAHCIAVDGTSGRVWHWTHYHQPVEVALEQRVQQITAHRTMSTLLCSQGHIWVLASLHPCQHRPTVLADPPTGDPFVQIAGMTDHVIGLTRSGRVFRIQVDHQHDGDEQRQHQDSKVELCGFTHALKEDKEHGLPVALSAHFQNFAILTCQGKALIGTQHQRADDRPLRILSLPGQSIIKVMFGDNHYGALTSQGRMLTWGRYSSGALGRGFEGVNEDEDQGGGVPQLVDRLDSVFVVDAGFGANHSGCTAIPRKLLQNIAS